MIGLVRLTIWSGVLVSTLGFLGGLHWTLDLCANFRPQLAVGGFAFGLLAMGLRLRVEAVGALFAAVANVAAVALIFAGEPRALGDAEYFTVMSVNVNQVNGDPERLAPMIRLIDPDVLGLIEVDEGWLEALGPTLKAWPHRIERPRSDNYGIALYSKWRLRGAKSLEMGRIKVPLLRAETRVNGRRVGLFLAHAPPPIGGALAADRDAVFAALATIEGPPDRVVFGDFNATPWSAPFRAMLTDGDLRMTRQGRGIYATWPASLGPAGIPIDHVLLGGRLATAEHEVLGGFGSDHRPIVAVVGCPPGE